MPGADPAGCVNCRPERAETSVLFQVTALADIRSKMLFVGFGDEMGTLASWATGSVHVVATDGHRLNERVVKK